MWHRYCTATFADIQKLLAEATTHAPALIKFEKGDYRLDPGGASAFLSFTNASDLIIDGDGGSFTFTDFLKFVKPEHCRRVLVRNFTFDFDPLPYTAGRVLAVDANAGTFEVEIAPGHPLPELDPGSKLHLGKHRQKRIPPRFSTPAAPATNLCHTLMDGIEDRIPALLEEVAQHLFVVTIKGADSPAEKRVTAVDPAPRPRHLRRRHPVEQASIQRFQRPNCLAMLQLQRRSEVAAGPHP